MLENATRIYVAENDAVWSTDKFVVTKKCVKVEDRKSWQLEGPPTSRQPPFQRLLRHYEVCTNLKDAAERLVIAHSNTAESLRNQLDRALAKLGESREFAYTVSMYQPSP